MTMTTTMTPTTTIDWILLTGQPGSGKTTGVKTITKFLQRNGVTVRGFYTDEVLSSDCCTSTRIGFDVVTVPFQKRTMLSRKNGPTHLPKTGNYSVYVTEFEQLVLPTLQRSDDDGNTVFILDEIGRMELHSKKFISAVRELLQPQDRQQDTPIIQKKTIRLIGAITAPIYGHRVPFCDEVSAHPGVKVHKIRKSNRDDVVNSLIQEIKDRWVDSDTNRNRKQTKKTTSSSSSPAKHAEGNAHGQHHLLDQDPITRIDGKKSKKNDDNDSYTSPPQITATKRKKITHKY